MQKPFSLKIILMCLASIVIAWGLFMVLSSPTSIHEPQSTPSDTPPPQLSIETLLSASDVEAGLLAAVQQGSDNDLAQWQRSLLSAAEQVGYSTQQLRFLQGDEGIDFLRFKGRRLWYHQEVEHALYNGLAFEPIAARFPETRDLHQATQQLFEKRNAILDALTETLLTDAEKGDKAAQVSYNQAAQMALQLWQQQFKAEVQN